jgi:hypothetical protein
LLASPVVPPRVGAAGSDGFPTPHSGVMARVGRPRIRTADPDGVVVPIDSAFLAAQPRTLGLTTNARDLDEAFTPAGLGRCRLHTAGTAAVAPDDTLA